MAGLELKINVRHSDTGGHIRTVTQFNNFQMNRPFNSLASTFSFDFYFDPSNKEHAEIVCVSHMHECQIFYNGKLELTGYILCQTFKDTGKPEWVPISGYSKAGVLNDCDTDADQSLETDGLSLRQIINKTIAPFRSNGIRVVYGNGDVDSIFVNKEDADDPLADDEESAKSAKEVSQNIGSYLSELAKWKGVVLSHDTRGNVWVKRPNTKSTPVLNLDMSDGSSDAFKIPGIQMEFVFNGHALHTKITGVQQADEDAGVNASKFTRTNPLIPIKESVLYRPRTFIVDSGNQFTMQQAVDYEMGTEVREAVRLTIDLGTASLNGQLIRPDVMVSVKNRNIFAYKKIDWYVESVSTTIDAGKEVCSLNCVLKFGYDFNYGALENVWVDPHSDLPKF